MRFLLGQKTVLYGKPLSGQMLYVLDASTAGVRLCGYPANIHRGSGPRAGISAQAGTDGTIVFFTLRLASGSPNRRLGRMLPDGDIEFMGRDDTQVKPTACALSW